MTEINIIKAKAKIKSRFLKKNKIILMSKNHIDIIKIPLTIITENEIIEIREYKGQSLQDTSLDAWDYVKELRGKLT